MDHVVALIVSPFCDVVEKGKTAARNAGNSQTMLRTARSLIREGERALSRIEPICRDYYTEFGTNFVDALKQDTEIVHHRETLIGLLWGFDEYVEAGGFDPGKYAQLEALSKNAAMKIYLVLDKMKLELLSMKLEPPARARDRLLMMSPPSSPLSSPQLGRPSILQPTATILPPTRGHGPSRPELATDVGTVRDATIKLEQFMQDHSLHLGDNDDSDGDGYGDGYGYGDREARETQPPPPSTARPRDNERCVDSGSVDQGPTAPRPESPVDPHFPHSSCPSPGRRGGQGSSVNIVRRPAASLPRRPDSDGSRQWRSTRGPSDANPASSYASRNVDFCIPEEAPAGDGVEGPPARLRRHLRRPPVSTHHPQALVPGVPRRPSDESLMALGEDGEHGQQRPFVVDGMPGAGCRPPAPSVSGPDATGAGQPPPPPPPPPPTSRNSPGLEVSEPTMHSEYVDGLIPLETEASNPKSKSHQSAKYSTIGASSSFHQLKGFCKGAKEVAKGGTGVRQVQKPVHRTLTRVVARCTGCSFELNPNQIESDMSKQDDGNYSTKAGVGYRLRFLQKSHLAVKRADDVPYGCVFCVHQGHTLDPSDATVFFTTQALFSHLARHPRPLPTVPGITVVEEAAVPAALRNDYDVHFQSPPATHPAHENQEAIAGRPTGAAREQARQLHGKRQPADRSPALELAQGARITGIRWPSRLKGEWLLGWHDGAYEAVPTDNVRLEPPAAVDMEAGGTGLACAKARWRFAPRDREKGGWLKFDKNETITNIGWPYPEHWCWSGTNAKGKRGIFPRAFIDRQTVREAAAGAADQASSPTQERGKTSMFPKLSVRKSGRPSSIAESTSSRDTGTAGFRVTSRTG